MTQRLGSGDISRDAARLEPLLAKAAADTTTGDLPTHEADANAHHNPVSVGAGGLSARLTVDANQVLTLDALVDGDIPSTIARDSEVTAAVAAHTAVANAHHDPVTVGDGLTLSVQEVALDTPGTLSASSANSASGNHTHAVTASSNPGAAETLLKSTGAGGLTLEAMTVNGALDVGQDLTVGANVLFVDESVGNVGINRVPDAQFDVDVAGALRAGALYGPIGRVLPDALMICQYDGKRPYATNYDVAVEGHLGQAAAVSGGVIGRPGRFGKAAQVAEAGTNLVPNPSFETGTAGWAGQNATLAQTTALSVSGGAALEITATGAGAAVAQTTPLASVAVSPSTQYRLDVWQRSDTAIPIRPIILWYTAASAFISLSNGTFAASQDAWSEYTIAATSPAAAAYALVYVCATQSTPAAGAKFYADKVHLYPSSYKKPYLDGGLGDGHSWSGTAHASSSSRVATQLSYANSIDAAAGTIGLWWQPAAAASSQPTGYLFDEGGLAAWFDSSDQKIKLTDGTNTAESSALSFAAEEWVFVTFTWGSGLTIYVNGVADGTASYTEVTPGATLWVGSDDAGANQANGMIDNLFVDGTEMSAIDVLGIYESNAPVTAATSTLTFRTPTAAPVWADEDGLFVRAADGDAVLGVIGVDGKSWGGLTLDAGDVLIGHTDEYVKWDASAATLEIAGKLLVLDDSSFDGVVGIGTSGGIYQGSGTFASPTTGLKLWNDSGVGRLAGYNGGTLQAGFNSAGEITAGGGVVLLNEDGIEIDGTTGKFSGSSIDWYDGANRRFSIGTEVDLGSIVNAYIDSPLGLSIDTGTSYISMWSDVDLRDASQLRFDSTYALRRNGTHIEWYNGSAWVQLD